MKRRSAIAALAALAAQACGGLVVEPPPAQEETSGGLSFNAAVPYVPTRPEVLDALLALAEISQSDVVYDLGCGDGRVVIAAAKRYGARGLGVDIDSILVGQAQAQAQWEGVAGRVNFRTGDLFDLDLRPATVVVLYLSVEVNVKLRPKLLAELRPGARIVSNRFDMADAWRPERSVMVGDTRIHLWRIPRRVA
jgi:SAM-dependent methyltransferase